nr:ubiquinone biosynthesis regulatory protein kinase UbiB [Simiduia agarivorans]
MIATIHLLRIYLTVLRFRLDELIPAQAPWWVRLPLLPAYLIPRGAHSRGERLRAALESRGPIFIKFGQLLSTRPDLIPADLVLSLSKLQDEVTPFAPARFRALVEQALGQGVDDVFARFDAEPLASASIAQVHAAQLKSGQEVIVKVVRPGLAPTIERDITLLLKLAKLVAQLSDDGRRLRPVDVVRDYRHTILDELNLQREAANCAQLRRNFSDSPLLYVPDVYWDYCRENLLVQERIYGIGVSDVDALQAQGTDMKLLAERGVEIFFTQVFKHNFFHADMHPGNIFVAREHPDQPQYIAIDTAIMGSLTQDDQYYLAANLVAMFRRDYRRVAQLHVDSGWVPAGTVVTEFESAIRTVCEPIFQKPLAEIEFSQLLVQLFRTARRFNMEVQPQLVLLEKTLLNIEGLGRQLYPQLDLWSTAHPFLEAWLKDRYHPRTLWADIKRFGPEWLEKLPHMPQKLYGALSSLEASSAKLARLEQLAENLSVSGARRRRSQHKRWLATAAALTAVALAIPTVGASLAAVPPISWGLASLAGVLWISA